MISQMVIISGRGHMQPRSTRKLSRKQFHQGIQTDEFEKDDIKGKLRGFQVLCAVTVYVNQNP